MFSFPPVSSFILLMKLTRAITEINIKNKYGMNNTLSPEAYTVGEKPSIEDEAIAQSNIPDNINVINFVL